MTNVSDFFDEQNFRSFEMRKFNGYYYYAVEPDYYNDGITRSRLYVRGCDRIHFDGVRVMVPLYRAEWSENDDAEISSCRSLKKEEYRFLDLAYFVYFPEPDITYEEYEGKWRICEKGEYRYQDEKADKSKDVSHFLELGYAPSLVEWYSARLVAGTMNKPIIQLLTEKYFPVERNEDEEELPF